MKVKKTLFKALQKLEKTYNAIVLMMIMSLVMVQPLYAAPPKLVTGTVALFSAISNWLLIIIPVGAGAVLGYHALQKSLSDDQAIIAEKNKLMKNVLIGAAIAETAVGLVAVVLSFYK